MSCCTLLTRLLTILQSWWNKGFCLAYFVLISCSVHWLMALEILQYHESNFKATILYLSLWTIYGRLQATGVSLCTYFFVVNICVFFVTENISSRQTFQSAFLGSKFLVASLCPPSSELQCGFLWCFCVFFFPQNVVGVTIGGTLGHSLCTGLAVIGGRLIAQRISVRTGTSQYMQSSCYCFWYERGLPILATWSI